MENAVIEALNQLQLCGSVSKDGLEALLADDLNSEFSRLVSSLTAELANHANLDDRVTPITGAGDADNFHMELSGFLREYGGCVHKCLMEGELKARFGSRGNKVLLLDLLASEVQAVRLIMQSQPALKQTTEQKAVTVASVLKDILLLLGFAKPPHGVTFFQLFSKVDTKLKELVSQRGGLSRPLLKTNLSEAQWSMVEYMNEALRLEYSTRHSMLLQRLDLTIQSFLWSHKDKETKVMAKYGSFQEALKKPRQITCAHILAATEDLLFIVKTSSGRSREKTKCHINKHRIGNVPDRGGRAYEHDAPPPEMPSFQQRQAGYR